MTRLEKTATASLVLSFLFLAGVVTRSYVLSQRPDPAAGPMIKVGAAVKLPAASNQDAESTLVLVLSSNCHYCMDSLPFYKQLSAFRRSSSSKLRLLAALPEDENSARTFLENAGIFTDGVLAKAPSDMGARIVPTLLLLGRENKLQRYWAGKLSAEAQAEVFAALRRYCSECNLAAASDRNEPSTGGSRP